MSGFLALAVAIGLVFGAHKLCDLIRAPRWFEKFFVYRRVPQHHLLSRRRHRSRIQEVVGYLGRAARRRNWSYPHRLHRV